MYHTLDTQKSMKPLCGHPVSKYRLRPWVRCSAGRKGRSGWACKRPQPELAVSRKIRNRRCCVCLIFSIIHFIFPFIAQSPLLYPTLPGSIREPHSINIPGYEQNKQHWQRCCCCYCRRNLTLVKVTPWRYLQLTGNFQIQSKQSLCLVIPYLTLCPCASVCGHWLLIIHPSGYFHPNTRMQRSLRNI